MQPLFDISITTSHELMESLTNEEAWRLHGCMIEVRKAACKMAMNMLKGVKKNERDDWTTKEWLDFLIDDATDTLNYAYLLKRSMK